MTNNNYYAAFGSCALLLFAISQPQPLHAQDTIGFKELVENFENLPINAQLNAIATAIEIDVRIAGMRPTPVISLGVENIFGSSNYKGFEAAETTLQISQDLQLFGRKQANINYAKSLAQSSKQEIAVKKQEYIKDLALLWLEFENANYQSNLDDEKINAAKDDLMFITLLVDGGREPKLRQLQAQSDLKKAEIAKLQTQNSINNSKNNLAVIAQYNGTIKSQKLFMEKMPSFGTFDISQNVNYQLLLSKQKSGKAAIELAKIDSKPNIGAYLGAKHLAANDAFSMVGGLSMTLPLGYKNQAILAQRKAQANANDIAIDSFTRNIEAQRLSLIAKINSSTREIAQLNVSITPLQEVYDLSKIGLKAGKISLIEVQAARNELFATKDKLRLAKFERSRAEIELSYIENRLPFEVSNEK
ncbi:TolC family protein [Pseudaquidulcibacter saccharophilus]|uniref:TolC family protein n=1 Tax=Pseudaquidulcibacter saccharophilus TaxID=2831900 RepID=UPI001EFF326D|nr:TolC family protein [Pseudaquidulcibacter saccharophilus]